MRYKYVLLYLVLALTLIFPGVAASASQKSMTIAELALYKGADRQQVLEEGAKKEGNLTFYTTSTEEQYRPFVKVFQQKYPYIKIDIWRGGTDTIVPRVTEEYKARKYVVDVMRVSGAGGIILRENGFLQPFFSPETANMEEAAVISPPDGKGAWLVGNCGSVQGLGYRTTLITREAVPKSYQDLLNPKWKGKMAIVGGSQGSSWMGSVLTTYGEKFVKQLAQQEITVHMVSARALCSMLSTGEVELSPTITDAHVIQDKQKGGPVDWAPLDPANVTLGQMALPIHSLHPHAAMLYIDLELSKEGGNIYKAIGFESPRKDMQGAKTYKKFYGAKSTKEVQEWHDMFRRLFLTK